MRRWLVPSRAQVPARDAQAPPLTGVIRGRACIAADTREPIRKARVDLIATIGDRRDPRYADNDGRFQFASVRRGPLTLSAWKSGLRHRDTHRRAFVLGTGSGHRTRRGTLGGRIRDLAREGRGNLGPRCRRLPASR